jgi:hypothetical protein
VTRARKRWTQLPLPGLYEGHTVELPPGINHGGPSAYNRYKCRCAACKAWRQSYDRQTWEIKNRQKQRNERKNQ